MRRLVERLRLRRSIAKELQAHLEEKIADLIDSGVPEADARARARREFGNVALIAEDSRAALGWTSLGTLATDIRYAFRSLRRSPGFAIVAVVSLALGIGANSAIFGVMDALMLRSLPVDHPEQLVFFGQGAASGVTDDFARTDLFSQPFYRRLLNKNAVLSDLAAMESMSDEVHGRFGDGASELEPVKTQLVSGNYFRMLGVGAYTGRVLEPEDDQTPAGSPVVVLRYGYWQRRFRHDPAVLGRKLLFNRTVFTIVGIAAPEFFGTEVGPPPDLWIPLAMQAQVEPWLDDPFGETTQSLWLIGRLPRGGQIANAQAYANLRFQQWLHHLAGSHPSAEQIQLMQKAYVKLTPAARGISRLRRRLFSPLQILMALAGLILLIACMNIANLLLARAGARQREIAVRIALGAQRHRLLRQLLVENLLLALLGGCWALLVANSGSRLLLAMVSNGPSPIPLAVGFSAPVLLFTLGVSVLTGLLFGTVPALQMTRVEVGPSLKEGKGLARSQTRGRLRSLLVSAQVSLAFFLTIAAGLFVVTLRNLEQTQTGFEKDRVLLVHLDADALEIKGPALMALYNRLEARIQSLPGVQAASFSMINFHEGRWSAFAWRPGVAQIKANAKTFLGNRVGAQYFKALGIPLVRGRVFGPQDMPKSPSVAVVDESFARTLFPNEPALGRHFSLGGHDESEIIGIVKDSKFESLRDNKYGTFFFYNGQAEDVAGFHDVVVRAGGRPEALAPEIRAAIRVESPDLIILSTITLAEQVDSSLGEEKLMARLAGLFGMLALLLAAIGLYGVISYSVARRTNEIGIRMALGARPAAILAEALKESLWIAILGLAAGVPAALACGRLVSSELYGVRAADPILFGFAAMVLIVTALAATFWPARRAALIDPVAALREE